MTTRPFLGLCCLPTLSLYPVLPMGMMEALVTRQHTGLKRAGLGAAQSLISQPVSHPRALDRLPHNVLFQELTKNSSVINLRCPLTYQELPSHCSWDTVAVEMGNVPSFGWALCSHAS